MIIDYELTVKHESAFSKYINFSCLSCADRWGRYAVLLEEKGEIKDQRSVEIKDQRSTACIVCCREMAADTVFEVSVDRVFDV